MSDLFGAIAALRGKHLYFFTEPAELDFTSPPATAKAVFCTEAGERAELLLPREQRQFRLLVTALKASLPDDEKMLVAWNVKSFLSYAKHIAGVPFTFGRYVYDLKVLAGFCGMEERQPAGFVPAMGLLLRISEHERAMTWYDRVYLPLATEVLPAVETVGLIDKRTRKVVYPCYDLEGSANGRLSCPQRFRNSFNPHGLRDDDKPHLGPLGYDKVYVTLDYRHVEVSVLQWLSGDPLLTAMIESGKDLYDAVWKEITGTDSDPEFRETCKGILLPVFYGMGVPTLAKKQEWPEDVAKRVRDAIYSKFSVAMGYVLAKQREAEETGWAEDYFGRRRRFTEKWYLARDFAVQAPASTICLHKLIRLHRELGELGRICFHVHDGYCIIADRACAGRVLERSRELLESPEEDFPGLRLIVKARIGSGLDSVE